MSIWVTLDINNVQRGYTTDESIKNKQSDYTWYEITEVYNPDVRLAKKENDGSITVMSESESNTYKDSYSSSIRNKSPLRIFEQIGQKDYLEVLHTDFSIVGLVKKSPKYVKGRKIEADYYCPNHNHLTVQKIFSDVIGQHDVWNGNTVTKVDGVVGLDVVFKWYDEDGNVSLTKNERAKNFNIAEEETMLRQRRERAIDYLTSSAKGTPAEPVLKALFDRYFNEVMLYKNQGTSELEDAINNEATEPFLTYLNIPITNPDESIIMIKDSILGQIT